MNSDLRHSLPDNTVRSETSMGQQIGVHIVTTAYCMVLLSEAPSDPVPPTFDRPSVSMLWNVDKSLSFFRTNIGLLDVLLNREPIYLAAQVMNIDEAVVDKDSARLWPLYQEIQNALSLLSDKDLALYEALANHVVNDGKRQGVVQYEIVLDGQLLNG